MLIVDNKGMPDTAILTVTDVSKQYGSKIAVDNVSLSVKKADAYALIGANGAGKTTLVRMIVGLEKPDRGSISIGQTPMNLYATAAKKRIGYVSDNPVGFEYVTGREFLYYSGSLMGLPSDKLKERVNRLLNLFPVAAIADEYMGSYSRGNRQKFSVISALISDPDILIIDEPIVGLDPDSIVILGNLIKQLTKSGKAVFFVTHILDFAARFSSRVGVMKSGRIIEEITPGKALSFQGL